MKPLQTTHLFRTLQGENPHQKAWLYVNDSMPSGSIFKAERLQGEELSFNDIVDTDGALALMREFSKEEGTVALFYHHGNPCALAIADEAEKAFLQAKENCDTTSVIEGILIINDTVDDSLAVHISEMYLHVLVCTDITKEAMDLLRGQDQLTVYRHVDMLAPAPADSVEAKCILGGVLVQECNLAVADKYETITGSEPDEQILKQLKIAWRVAKHTKTNAIVLVKDNGTIGIGPGLNNRIWSMQEAIRRAGEKVKGSVMSSDAIIPLPETIAIAGKAGVKAIIEPGGWFKEDENIAEAKKHDMTIVVTGINQFKH